MGDSVPTGDAFIIYRHGILIEIEEVRLFGRTACIVIIIQEIILENSTNHSLNM